MKHIDLFSGIGGFALAVDNIYGKSEHIFVESDPFCQQVLRKHWQEAEIHGDIREFVANAKSARQNGGIKFGVSELGENNIASSNAESGKSRKQTEQERRQDTGGDCFLLTGGFPCQPFSQAGRRKGTADDRYLWEPMFECVQVFKPQWVIAENVRGLVTWNEGMVLEQVCADLESEGYEVRAFIIPAVAVNAPHRRDRVWIVANRRQQYGSERRNERVETSKTKRTARTENIERCGEDDTDTERRRPHHSQNEQKLESERSNELRVEQSRNNGGNRKWNENWIEVATRLCRVDDGLPRRMDRNPRLKALGNAIVPQVAEEIMRAIKESEQK